MKLKVEICHLGCIIDVSVRARTWVVELGLIWEKLKQLVRYRPQDLVGQLRALVAIETVLAVVQECQATAVGAMDY